jgi:2-polyprenyl-3-methyl-5-hydroxy-6-metoxy-1,4-benzoquinol methylase
VSGSDPKERAGCPLVAGLALQWREFRATGRGDCLDSESPAFGLWMPQASLDALVEPLTQEEFARSDERLPYFATLWPAAEALATRVLNGPRLDGRQVLDLGCGLGACGFAAAQRGARVTFFDWEPRALEIVAASARAQAAPVDRFQYIVGDWRKPPTCGPFDLILGADVLYEARNGPAVATFLARHLAPGGEAWLADPGRPHAQAFPALAGALDLAAPKGWVVLQTVGNHRIAVLRVRRG